MGALEDISGVESSQVVGRPIGLLLGGREIVVGGGRAGVCVGQGTRTVR